MIELAAFLGNPGKEYSHNRHNAGFLLAEKLPFYNALSWQKKFKGLYAAMERHRLGEYRRGISEAAADRAFIRRTMDAQDAFKFVDAEGGTEW